MGWRRERILKEWERWASCWQSQQKWAGRAKLEHLNLGIVPPWALSLLFLLLPTSSPPGSSLSSLQNGGIGPQSHAALCTPGE